MTDPRTALLEESIAIGAVLAPLNERQFAVVTNCPPWTLKEMVVHLWGTIGISASGFEDAPGPPRSSAEYFLRSERETDEYRQRNIDRTQRAAARYPVAQDAVSAFVDRARQVTAQLASDDLDRIIAAQHLGAMTIRGYIETRVVAVAAHGLDVMMSLDLPPVTTPGALEISAAVLTEMLGAAAPSSWTEANLLAFGTGRVPLDAGARLALGSLAGRFPLLS